MVENGNNSVKSWNEFMEAFPLSTFLTFLQDSQPTPPTPPSPLSSAFPAACCCCILAGACCLLSAAAGPKFYRRVAFDFGSDYFEFFGFWEKSKNPESCCVCVCAVCVQCAVLKFQIKLLFLIIWQQTFNEFHQIYDKFCHRKKLNPAALQQRCPCMPSLRFINSTIFTDWR